MHVNFWTFIWIYVYSFFIKRTKTGDTNSEIEACLADANFVPLLLRSIPQNVGRKSRKLQKSRKKSRTKVLPLMIRKPRRYSTAQWRDAWKHFFGLLHYSSCYITVALTMRKARSYQNERLFRVSEFLASGLVLKQKEGLTKPKSGQSSTVSLFHMCQVQS